MNEDKVWCNEMTDTHIGKRYTVEAVFVPVGFERLVTTFYGWNKVAKENIKPAGNIRTNHFAFQNF